MRKKFLTLLLAVAASIGTMFAEPVQIGDLYYNLDATNQTAEVTSQNSSYPYWSTTITSAIIPASVTYNEITYSVTSIGYAAFAYCTDLSSVTIPNSVTSIGDNAFEGCSSMTSIEIPGSVTSIGHNAFLKCFILKSVYSNDLAAWCGITFDRGASNPLCYAHHLYLNETEIKDLEIPNSVTSIGNYAFYGCSGLTSVTIPNSVTSIGDYAFYECTGLTSVTIPNSVTSIGDGAFYYCTGLTSVVWNAKNYADFASNNTPFYVLRSQITSFTFSNEVEHIPAYLCNGMSNLTSVTIPNSVTSIGGSAFYGCSGLTSVTIPNSVTSIGNWTFSGCSGLTSPIYNAHIFAYMPTSYSGTYKIPDGIELIAGGAFENCSGLTSVTIGNSVTSIGHQAFDGCSGLTSVTIPNSVTSIGYFVFNKCSGLTSVTIGNSVTSIGDYAFYECTGLTSVIVENGNTIYDSRDNCNAIIETATNTLIAGCKNTTIPNSVTSIENHAFSYCSGLTSVTIPNSVTSIGYYAFYGCTGLTSVTIGNSVTSIGDYAFYECTGLTSVTCFATTPPPMMGSNVFYNVNCSKIPLYVPDESIEDYKAAEQWNLFSPILPLSQKPQESEAIDEIIVEDLTSSTKKILHNGQIYILRGDKTYTTDGRLVR